MADIKTPQSVLYPKGSEYALQQTMKGRRVEKKKKKSELKGKAAGRVR